MCVQRLFIDAMDFSDFCFFFLIKESKHVTIFTSKCSKYSDLSYKNYVTNYNIYRLLEWSEKRQKYMYM